MNAKTILIPAFILLTVLTAPVLAGELQAQNSRGKGAPDCPGAPGVYIGAQASGQAGHPVKGSSAGGVPKPSSGSGKGRTAREVSATSCTIGALPQKGR